MFTVARRALGAGLLTLLATCDSGTAPSAGPIARIEVQPKTVEIELQMQAELEATVTDAVGNPVQNANIFWSAENEEIAEVSPNGVVTGRAVGITRIAASSAGVDAIATVHVVPRVVTSVEVTPSSSDLLEGETVELTAIAKDRLGREIEGRAVTWESEDTRIARVDPDGTVTAMGEGSTTITATIDGVSDDATIKVQLRPIAAVSISPDDVTLPVGAKQAFEVKAFAEGGDELAARDVVWSSDNPGVIAIDKDDGVATAISPGVTRIRALVDNVSAQATVRVILAPVASVEVRPESATLPVQGTRQFNAILKTTDGTVVTGRTVAWSSSNTAVATVNANGLVTALSPGKTEITAISEGKQGEAELNVTTQAVESVDLSPSSASLLVGDTRQFTAIPRADDGSRLDGREIEWSTSDDDVAAVDDNGLVTAVGPGDARITATVEGKSASADVEVDLAPVASIELNPKSAQLTVLQSRQFSATLKDAAGRVLTGRTVTWSSSNGLVASVNSSGLVRALVPGTAEIRATSEGKTATAIVTVSLQAVAAVEVSPESANLVVGEERKFTATPLDSEGKPLSLDGRTVSWNSSDSKVVSVSPDGTAKALAPGVAELSVTVEGKRAEADVAVKEAPVARVEVEPSTATITLGSTQEFTATAFDAAGNVLTGRKAVWTATPPSIARIGDDEGVAEGIGIGEATVKATIEGKEGTATLTVTPVPVASVTVEPGTATIEVGEEQQFSATAKDANGNVLTGREVTWSITPGDMADLDSNGKAVGKAVGQATVKATVEGKEGTATLDIKRKSVHSVTISPPSAELLLGRSIPFTVEVKAKDGSILDDRVVTWSVPAEDAGVLSVSPTGTATAIGVGEGVVVATVEGVSDAAEVKVEPVPITSVTLTPGDDAIQIEVDQEVSFTATVRDLDNKVVTGAPLQWTSSNPGSLALGPHDNSGATFKGLSPGSSTITVSTENGIKDSAVLTVVPKPVSTVEVLPESLELIMDATGSVEATLRAADGSVLEGRTVTWSSADPLVATVTGLGYTATVQAIGPGSTQITAASEEKSDAVAVTVVPKPVARVQIEPTSANLNLISARTQDFTVKLFAADDSELTDRQVSWSSSNSNVVRIEPLTANGYLARATSVFIGSATITASSEGRSASVDIQVALSSASGYGSVERLAAVSPGARGSATDPNHPPVLAFGDEQSWLLVDEMLAAR